MNDDYWADIIRLLQVFWAADHEGRLDELKVEFASPIYRSSILKAAGTSNHVPLRFGLRATKPKA